jgi:hypothetical protein
VCTRLFADGSTAAYVQGADYTVSGGGGSTGSVKKTASGPVGTIFRIQRVTSQTQTTGFSTATAFPATNVEKGFDRAMKIAQENGEGLVLLRRQTITGNAADNIPALPAAPSRVAKFMQWAADGKSVLLLSATDTASVLFGPIKTLIGNIAKGDPGGNITAVGLFNALAGMIIPNGTNRIGTTGYSLPGRGAVSLKQVGAGPATAYRAQSQDGAWWEVDGENGASLKALGALGDNAANDAAAGQAGHDNYALTVIPPGTYRFNPDTAAAFSYRNTAGAAPLYGAVSLTRSGITIRGDGLARIRPAMRAGGASAEVQFAFISNNNTLTGVQTDFTFDRVGIDTNNDGLIGNSNQRGYYLIGVQRVRFLNPVAISTGDRRGTAIGDIDNCADVLISGFQQHNTTQLANLRYCDGVSIWGGTARNCPELFDMDSVDRRVTVGGFTYVGPGRGVGGSSQMLDLNSTIDATIGYIAATDVGNLYLVNFKQTTPPDYATYLQYPGWQANHAYIVGDKIFGSYFAWQAATAGTSGNAAPADLTATAPATTVGLVDGANGLTWNRIDNPFTQTPSARLVIGPMTSTKTGPAGANAMSIGNEWRTDGGLHHEGVPPCNSIAVPYHYHDDTTGLLVWDGSRLQIGPGAYTNVNAQGGSLAWGIDMQSAVATGPAFEWSDLDAVVTDHVFDTVEKGGLRARYAARLTIRALKTRNMNTTATAGVYALALTNLDQRHCRVTVDECEFDSGDVQISAAISSFAAWAASTAYYKHQIRTNGGNFYECTTSGTSAGAGGPTGTGTGIVDGTAVWRFVRRPLEIRWGALNWMRDTGAVAWGGDAHKYVLGETKNVILPDLPATATTRRFTVFKAERRCIVLRAWLVSPDAVAASATNFRTVLLKTAKLAAGVPTEVQVGTTQSFAAVGLSASVERQMMGAAMPVAAQELFPGDSLIVQSDAGGTGMALNGVSIGFEVMPL